MGCDFKESHTIYLVCKCFNILTINIAFLVIGIVLYMRKSTDYGLVIRDETAEWSKGPIVDIIDAPLNGTCPSSYELVPVSFPGTRTICRRYSGTFIVGQCRRRDRFGFTEIGLDSLDLNIFNGVQICVKRNSVINYHSMVKQRSSVCSQGFCGSSNDTEKRFCKTENTCPITNITV